jgi:hypothetical protein
MRSRELVWASDGVRSSFVASVFTRVCPVAIVPYTNGAAETMAPSMSLVERGRPTVKS